MRKAAFAFVIFGFVGMAVFTIATHLPAPAEAQRGVGARFEYAVINGPYLPYPADGPSSVSSAVNICYLQASGCQNEEVRAEINISKFLQDERLENASNARSLAVSRAANTAYSRAIAKLGGDGWELVEAPPVEFDLYYTNQQGIQTVKTGQQSDRKHVWFKRIRQ
jgi:hypothetical protein